MGEKRTANLLPRGPWHLAIDGRTFFELTCVRIFGQSTKFGLVVYENFPDVQPEMNGIDVGGLRFLLVFVRRFLFEFLGTFFSTFLFI